MDAASVKTIAVLGAGTMGHGIAQVAAQAGYDVVLWDLDEPRWRGGLVKITANLDKGVEKGKLSKEARDAALARIRGTANLPDAGRPADVAIEAVAEDLGVKVQILGEIARHAKADAILASNTSSLSLTELAAALPGPQRVIGMHFFNPVHLMKLIELVRAHQTSPETLAIAKELAVKFGKESIVVRDAPGFASSRLGIALGMEAIRMLEEGVATAEEIDRAMKLGYGHPMGPLELTDLVGLDVRLAIGDYLHRELGQPQFRPPQLLKRLVRAGKLGKKSGEGFYKY